MTKPERELDPAAIARFQDLLSDAQTRLEQGPIAAIARGTLSYAPAFGLTETGQARGREYHEATAVIWNDLQGLHATLRRLRSGLDDVVDRHDESEAVSDAEQRSVGHSLDEPLP